MRLLQQSLDEHADTAQIERTFKVVDGARTRARPRRSDRATASRGDVTPRARQKTARDAALALTSTRCTARSASEVSKQSQVSLLLNHKRMVH